MSKAMDNNKLLYLQYTFKMGFNLESFYQFFIHFNINCSKVHSLFLPAKKKHKEILVQNFLIHQS